MKKLKKFLFLGSSIATISVSSIIFSSAKVHQKADDPQPPNNSGDKPKPKTISPLFDSFKDKAKTMVETAIKTSIEKVIAFIKEELQKIEKIEDKPENYLKKLERKIYFDVLQNYFEKNKDKVIKEFATYGFPVTFPYILSQEKKYKLATVKFNDKVFSDVKIGNSVDLDYSKFMKTERGDKVSQEGTEDNFISNEDFTKIINKYQADLEKQIIDIVFDEAELPKLGKDIFLKQDQFSQGGNSVNGYSVTLPKGVSSWEEYLKSKIEPRFIEFDLKQNEESKIEEETQQKPQTLPPTLPKPPLVPNKDPINPITVDPKVIPESLLSLIPITSYKYVNHSFTSIKSSFDSLPKEEREKMFFFKNPINTRFKYTVDNLEFSSGTLSATVRITDLSKPSLSRKYFAKIEKEDDEQAVKRNLLLEKQIEAIRKKFIKFYEAMGLDEKITYSQLGNDELQLSLFGMVNLATSVARDKDFEEKWEKILKKYSYSIESDSLEDHPQFDSPNFLIIEQLLQALTGSTINGANYWNSIINAYQVVESELRGIAAYKTNKEAVQKNFKTHDLDTIVVDRLFESLNLSILRLKSVSREWTKTYNFSNWFDKYVSHIKEVSNHFELLRYLIEPKEKPEGSKEAKLLIEKYNEAINVISEYKESKRTAQQVLGWIFFSLGLIANIINTLLFFLKYKKNQNKNNKIIFITTTVISSIVTIMGLILALIGMKGII
ncbi:MSC_0620 family F1-like ATPase-associated subunit [Mycoplasmopsis hyopharyngis]|uniref:MSC_0620 family F1-like ATPase-associated subunit n=1 Tax=Mycoplasmopsis hyopharyngis TaxID=29558 RepID=UPI0038734417